MIVTFSITLWPVNTDGFLDSVAQAFFITFANISQTNLQVLNTLMSS